MTQSLSYFTPISFAVTVRGVQELAISPEWLAVNLTRSVTNSLNSSPVNVSALNGKMKIDIGSIPVNHHIRPSRKI